MALVLSLLAFGSLLALVIVGIGALSDLIDLADTAGPSNVQESVIESMKRGLDQKIAVIDIKGMIVSAGPFDVANAGKIASLLADAGKEPEVVAVVLDMNTPGGGVIASEELHRAVRKVHASGKPVVTSMGAVAASGGYMIAAGTDHIVAHPLTLTGSIGVIISTINYAELFDKLGLEFEVYKSGDMKDMLSGGRRRTPAERDYANELIRENFEAFAQIVADGRSGYGSKEEVLAAEFADGRVLTGRRAMTHGLVDQLGYLEDAVEKARELANAPNATPVRYKKAASLREMLLSAARSKQAGVRSLLPRETQLMQPGRYYYVMPTIIP